jgi:hypothetical protein
VKAAPEKPVPAVIVVPEIVVPTNVPPVKAAPEKPVPAVIVVPTNVPPVNAAPVNPVPEMVEFTWRGPVMTEVPEPDTYTLPVVTLSPKLVIVGILKRWRYYFLNATTQSVYSNACIYW